MIKVADEELLLQPLDYELELLTYYILPNEAILIKFLHFCWQYNEVWSIDEKDPLMKPGGESVDDVASRIVEAVANMESQFQG